ncbi:THO complex subunit 3 [Rhodotorula mucilaginosa]|uniref:THO complex subunit 3 n=1 Tax=Rhodotorula mucilaginosa TaxID=5537 RepID=A0A9P6VYP0_RHOMI|nr:THO complex subunit 3 [Rhodotorula mucilaginosa]
MVAAKTSDDFSRYATRRIGTGRERVRSVAWNLDGRRLATGGTDKVIRVYLPDKDPRAATDNMPSWAIWTRGLSFPLRIAAQDTALHFWDLRQGHKPVSTVETLGENLNMAWSSDGKTIVIGNRNDKVVWVDVEEQKITRRIDMGKDQTNECLFAHNDAFLITGVEGSARITSFPENEPIHSFDVGTMPVTVIDLDPRGRYFVAGCNDTLVSLWETEDWSCVATSGVHDDPVRMARFSQDGNYVASCAADGQVVILSVPNLEKVASFTVPGGNSETLAWHPTRNVLAYVGQETGIWGAGL